MILNNDDIFSMYPKSHNEDITHINPNNITYTDEKGYFQIKADLDKYIYFQSKGHYEEFYPLKYLLTRGEISVELEPKRCIEDIDCNDLSNKMYAFIGKKISVKQVYRDYCDMILDEEYEAKYKILENVYGDYPNKIIEFISFEHGIYRNYYDFDPVLLYVVERCGKLYQVKHQYDRVYKTKDGKWASTYNSWLYNKLGKDTAQIKPERILFKKNANLRFKGERDINKLKTRYPSPFFKFKNRTVIPVYGNYVKDIFELRKRTSLKPYVL